ncbi:hypothetical protein Tco_0633208 [Tanacetum coccineum]
MGTEDEYSDVDDELNLLVAIRNLIGIEHVLEIKSHTYYEYGSFESFNCWKINPNASAEDGASSSTTVVTANDVESSMKIVTKPPTVCTPLKPNEEKKQKGHDLEDSDVDEVSGPQKNTGKSNAKVVVDTKKKRKRHTARDYGPAQEFRLSSSHNNQRITPSFRGLLQNSVNISADTIIGPSGRVQSAMNNGINPLPFPDTTRLNSTDIAGPSTSKYASTRLPRRSAGVRGPTHSRRAKKGTKKAAFIFAGGKVLLPRFHDTPPLLNRLLSHDQPSTAKLRDQIRVYNSMFSFTSFRAKIDNSINTGRAPYTFRINEQNYHQMGSLPPEKTSEDIDKHIVGDLINMLDRYSSVAQAFRMARDLCNTHSSADFRLRLHSKRKTTWQYNAPTVSEVAAIIINDFGDAHPTQDIVVDRKDTGPQRVSELHPSYMAL